ncbi:MAG: PQQ-binding-like beta-propeller repeat protein, partial [Phycisphaeraceae bacterium]|nr:PQQ-binding-like beta-propeller repeat protein [Phycisphaeraceae bacterium]
MAGPVWPGWRGDGSGVSDEIQAPMQWDQEHGITWKTRIAGEGNSSPIVWHDKVFLTASTQNGQTRLIICVSAETGNILWQTPVVGEQTRTYPKSGRASPTPVTDGRRVYALFDAPGLVALDMDGQVLWTKTLGPFENVYNMASSPIVVGDLVIVNCDHSGPSFIVAFDKVTGDERWRTPRKGGLHYSTPIVVPRDGVNQVVVNAHTIVAYAAATGEPIWWFEGMKHATTPTALFHNGLVYATSGRNGPSVAIDPGGSGDVSATHVRMHVSSGGPYVVSPLIVAGQLVLPGDNGRMLVVDDQGR